MPAALRARHPAGRSGIGRGSDIWAPRVLAAVLGGLLLAACAPRVAPMGPPIQPPTVTDGAFTMADGYRLPYRRWGASGAARAIIIGLHGFNDYSAFLSNAGPVWAERGIATFAYDQRGFGETAGRGLWHGRAALIADARAVAGLIRARYPDRPLFLLGESMGGAVAIAAVSGRPGVPVAGTVLTAPAATDWQGFAWYQRWTMWAAAHTLPWLEVTGQGLRLQPSDNIAMLRALSRDPLVIKRTRIDALWGLLRLGDRAFDVADTLPAPALLLWGAREELIPERARDALDARLPDHVERRVYPEGYHMLTRDKAADIVLADIADWVLAKALGGPLD